MGTPPSWIFAVDMSVSSSPFQATENDNKQRDSKEMYIKVRLEHPYHHRENERRETVVTPRANSMLFYGVRYAARALHDTTRSAARSRWTDGTIVTCRLFGVLAWVLNPFSTAVYMYLNLTLILCVLRPLRECSAKAVEGLT